MDFVVIESGLPAWVQLLTGIAVGVITWENAPRSAHEGARVLLSWVETHGVGIDEQRWDFDAEALPLEQMVPAVHGVRSAVLQVLVEVHEQRPGHTARAVLEGMRTRMRMQGSLDALRAIGLGLADTPGNVVKLDAPSGGRIISRAALDVRFNATDSVTDDGGKTSYIDSVETVTDVRRPDGTALPPSLG